MIPDDIRERIEKGLASAPAGTFVDFMTDTAALCRRCGTPVMKRQRLRGVFVMQALPSYREVTVEFDDGSANVMSLCGKCAHEVRMYATVEELEWMYCADLKSWNNTGPMTLSNWNAWGRRKPVGVKP